MAKGRGGPGPRGGGSPGPKLTKAKKGLLSYAGVGAKKWGNWNQRRKGAAQEGYAEFLANQAAGANSGTNGGQTGPGLSDADEALKAHHLTQQQTAIANMNERAENQRNALGGSFYTGGGTAFDQWQNDVWLPQQIANLRATYDPHQLYTDVPAGEDRIGTDLNLPDLKLTPELLAEARSQFLNTDASRQAGAQFFNPTGRWSWWD